MTNSKAESVAASGLQLGDPPDILRDSPSDIAVDVLGFVTYQISSVLALLTGWIDEV